MTRDRTRLGWRVVLVAVSAGLLFAPFSSGGGFPGRDGRIVVVQGGDVLAVSTSGTTDTLSSSPSADPPVAGTNSGAAMSPDGSKVAYTSGGDIHVVCVDGSCDHNLGAGSEPAWSPDGTTLAYTNANTIYTIGVNADGTANGSAQSQTPGATDNTEPAWSPDGSEIAFASERGGTHYEIWTVSATGGTQTQVTSNSGTEQDRQPTWSPDGDTIAFQSNRANGTDFQLYTVPRTGGSVTQITSDGSSDIDPVWSPDGSEIAFARSTGDPTVDGVYDVSSSGGTPARIVALASPVETSDWEVLVPLNTSAPRILADSSPSVGDTVSASPGSWSGVDTNVADAYEYQFLRCDPDGHGCTALGSYSDSSTYTLQQADEGATIAVNVFARNHAGAGQNVESSNHSSVVLGPGPNNLTVPTITLGSIGGVALTQPKVGSTVFASIGTWTGFPNTYTYQWKKCDPTTGSCFAIAGATTSVFIPTADTYGFALRVEVDAQNPDGKGFAQSVATGVVTADAPLDTVSPPIAGTNQVGSTLTVGTGTWTGTVPLTFTYQWRRCNAQGDLSSCIAIAGATSPTYVLTAADQGVALRAYVTAKNVAGSVTAFTNHTFPILPATKAPPPPTVSPIPANTTAPAIVGTASVGSVLTASSGVWTGKAPLRYTYRWQRCDPLGAHCRAIPSATHQTYTLARGDLGSTVRVGVTARNTAGVKSVVSTVTDTISLAKPVPRGRHIVGTNGPNYLPGGGGNDTIQGRGGNDTILGGAGDDRLFGGAGNDVIDGGPGKDTIFGGPGNDTIRAADGVADTIDCGPGRDHATVDAIDVVKGCELVTVVTAAPPTTSTP